MAQAADDAVVITIREGADAIDRIAAIRAVRDFGRLGLAEAKRAVDDMAERGFGVIANGPYVAMLAHHAVFGHARGLKDRLDDVGIAVRVAGRPLEDVLDESRRSAKGEVRSVTIEPLDGGAAVEPVAVVRALRGTGAMDLAYAKALLDLVVEEGNAELPAWYAAMLCDPAMEGYVRQVVGALAEAGVAVLVDGVPIHEWLDRGAEPAP